MPLCGFNKKMINGISILSEGLFEATIERGQQNKIDDFTAIKTEVQEIDLFIKALQDKYGTARKTSKKMAEMVFGIAVFAAGLFESTLAQNGHATTDLQVVFKDQVRRVSSFLEQLENQHQQIKKSNSPELTVIKAVDWIDSNDN